MYEGKNPKALLSISLITEAFIREMHHKKYEEINVKDLCKEADVSRQTFYNIFRTKEHVLRKCIDNIFDMILNQCADTVDAIASIHIFVKTFYKNRDFMDLLIRNHLEKNSLIDFLVCRDRGDVMLPLDFLIGSWWHIGRCFLLGDRTYQCLCGFFTSERTVSVLFNLCIYLIYISTTGYSI